MSLQQAFLFQENKQPEELQNHEHNHNKDKGVQNFESH